MDRAMAPFGVQHLLASSEVTVTKESTCCKRFYSVSSYQGGLMLLVKRKGSRSYRVTDARGNVIAYFRVHSPIFKTEWLEVALARAPMVKVRMKGGISRPILVLDEQDQQVLKVKPKSWRSMKYAILGANDAFVGSMKKDGCDCDVVYPTDLEVRFKVGLLAAIIYSDYIEESAAAASSND